MDSIQYLDNSLDNRAKVGRTNVSKITSEEMQHSILATGSHYCRPGHLGVNLRERLSNFPGGLGSSYRGPSHKKTCYLRPLPTDPAVLPATESVPPNFDFGVTSAVTHHLKFSSTKRRRRHWRITARQRKPAVMWKIVLKYPSTSFSPSISPLSFSPWYTLYKLSLLPIDVDSCLVDRGGNYVRSFTYWYECQVSF